MIVGDNKHEPVVRTVNLHGERYLSMAKTTFFSIRKYKKEVIAAI